ncbi:MAG TPA: hypothetical protein PLJ29_17620, partial [Leptospiraceae bacterium]|nr:hypothetical protein [Leptospiraceae bacterium]
RRQEDLFCGTLVWRLICVFTEAVPTGKSSLRQSDVSLKTLDSLSYAKRIAFFRTQNHWFSAGFSGKIKGEG